MSTDSVKQIIGRAVAEPEFRGLLFRDPAQALAGYDLDANEAASLRAMSAEQFDTLAADLEPRVSKSLGAVKRGDDSVPNVV